MSRNFKILCSLPLVYIVIQYQQNWSNSFLLSFEQQIDDNLASSSLLRVITNCPCFRFNDEWTKSRRSYTKPSHNIHGHVVGIDIYKASSRIIVTAKERIQKRRFHSFKSQKDYKSQLLLFVKHLDRIIMNLLKLKSLYKSSVSISARTWVISSLR